MALKDTIVADMKSAMREADKITLETIRLLRAAIQRKEMDDKVNLNDAGVLQIVQKMVKQCKDAQQQFSDGGRDDLAAKEQSHIKVLQGYLPAPLSDDEIEQIIHNAITQTAATARGDMGKVMAVVKEKIQGRGDMGLVSTRIKLLLA